MDPRRKVSRGERVAWSAAFYNDLVDTVAWRERVRALTGADPTALARSAGIVPVRNDSGANRDRFEVLGLGADPAITPTDSEDEFARRPVLSGAAPALATHFGRFAVLLRPLATDEIGPAVVFGQAVVKVDVLATEHGYADVFNGSAAKLRTGAAGAARILWKESGTGDKWAVVTLGAHYAPYATFLVDLLTDGGTDGSGTVSPTYTYKVRKVGSTYDLRTGQSPEFGRKVGKFTVATRGMAYYTEAGVLTLLHAYEQPGRIGCG